MAVMRTMLLVPATFAALAPGGCGSTNATNLVFKRPGWRAREGRGEPVLGVPGGSGDPAGGKP
ncbi:MAG TPA: hypothetical protein VLY46_09100 [Usitatibacter sp.]|nr:hypothetical protein [Usitatibacter sp.]